MRGNVGLSDFSDAAVKDQAVLAVAGKVRYQIDPNNPYPNNFVAGDNLFSHSLEAFGEFCRETPVLFLSSHRICESAAHERRDKFPCRRADPSYHAWEARLE